MFQPVLPHLLYLLREPTRLPVLLRRHILLPKRGSGGMILALALMQTVIQYTFFYIGLSHAPASKGSIISPTSTFFALLIAALVFRQERLTAKKLLGCLIGFAGVLAVSLNGRMEGGMRLDVDGEVLPVPEASIGILPKALLVHWAG